MCGRFVSASPPSEIADYFGVDAVAEQLLDPNWNVAPTNDVYVVYTDGGMRRLDPLHWGFVPSWAKDLSVGNRMINARAETIASKKKQPYFIHRPDGEPFAFGGLWTQWHGKDASGEDITVRSVTIITGRPN